MAVHFIYRFFCNGVIYLLLLGLLSLGGGWGRIWRRIGFLGVLCGLGADDRVEDGRMYGRVCVSLGGGLVGSSNCTAWRI